MIYCKYPTNLDFVTSNTDVQNYNKSLFLKVNIWLIKSKATVKGQSVLIFCNAAGYSQKKECNKSVISHALGEIMWV